MNSRCYQLLPTATDLEGELNYILDSGICLEIKYCSVKHEAKLFKEVCDWIEMDRMWLEGASWDCVEISSVLNKGPRQCFCTCVSLKPCPRSCAHGVHGPAAPPSHQLSHKCILEQVLRNSFGNHRETITIQGTHLRIVLLCVSVLPPVSHSHICPLLGYLWSDKNYLHRPPSNRDFTWGSWLCPLWRHKLSNPRIHLRRWSSFSSNSMVLF